MSISFILITFLLQLSVGMMATVAILPTALVDFRFFKSISFWGVLFTALALVLKRYSTFHLSGAFGDRGVSVVSLEQLVSISYSIFLASLILLWGRLRFKEGTLSKTFLIVTAFIGLVAVGLESLLYRPQLPPLWAQNILVPLHFISASLILGGFLAGMIFGHYYLVTTNMPKRLLVTMAWILIGVLVLRLVAVGTSLALYGEVIKPGTDFLEKLTSLQGHGIFFWQRILIGLAIPSVVVAMIWSTARIGSNQSATGIMYVAIAFVFIGELVARYLFLVSAIPL